LPSGNQKRFQRDPSGGKDVQNWWLESPDFFPVFFLRSGLILAQMRAKKRSPDLPKTLMENGFS
jgi:hypothetical protein